jgi:hypothetical protein
MVLRLLKIIEKKIGGGGGGHLKFASAFIMRWKRAYFYILALSFRRYRDKDGIC